ncbi:MAG: response regulator [Lachnospiraceae bacterium]|nr:response regulator [Lachnospiraceae bacterium]
MAKVLMVDDSRTSRKLLRGILEEAGHEIVGEATNGQEGVQQFQALKPELVTMDITMPVLDGVEALKMIKALDKNSKVIMVTAAGQKGKVMECIKAGADEFITKPFEAKEITSAVEKVAGNKE